AVTHDQDRHRRAADDVDLRRPLTARSDMAEILANQRIQRVDDALLGNADEDDRLMVLDHVETADDAGRIDSNEDVDRLAGIAHGAGEIRIEIDIAGEFIAAIDRSDGWIALYFAEAVRALEELAR